MKQLTHHGYAVTVTANNDTGLWRAHAIITWDKGKFEMDDEPDGSRKPRRRIGKALGEQSPSENAGLTNGLLNPSTVAVSDLL